MIDYFDQVIMPYARGQPCALVLDDYGVHWTTEVLVAAFHRKIELIHIPKGQTGVLRPLDVSFNSKYKRYRQQLLRDAISNHQSRLEDRRKVVLRSASAASLVSKGSHSRWLETTIICIHSSDKPILFNFVYS
jgi:hypothetical protein